MTIGGAINGAFSYNKRMQPLQIFFGTNAPGSLGGTSCPSTVGNIMHRKYEFHPGNGDNGNVYTATNCRDTSRNQNFDYDSLNRIGYGYTNGSTTAIQHWGETFTLDAWGNLTNIGGYAGKPNHENLNAAPANIKTSRTSCRALATTLPAT